MHNEEQMHSALAVLITISAWNSALLDERSALAGTKAPQNIRAQLKLVNVRFWGFDKKVHEGQIVVHASLQREVRDIFADLQKARFPIQSLQPIDVFGWSDEKSMLSNNSSGFNYRRVFGSNRLSDHSFGRAIDLNPRLNPDRSHPVCKNWKYDPHAPGAINEDSRVYKAFVSRGWKWGGHWRTPDPMHFYKR